MQIKLFNKVLTVTLDDSPEFTRRQNARKVLAVAQGCGKIPLIKACRTLNFIRDLGDTTSLKAAKEWVESAFDGNGNVI